VKHPLPTRKLPERPDLGQLKRQAKELLGQMKRGDEVMTAGGIYGKIVEVRDSKVLVKVDETSNTKIWFSREAIRKVLTEEKADAVK